MGLGFNYIQLSTLMTVTGARLGAMLTQLYTRHVSMVTVCSWYQVTGEVTRPGTVTWAPGVLLDMVRMVCTTSLVSGGVVMTGGCHLVELVIMICVMDVLYHEIFI